MRRAEDAAAAWTRVRSILLGTAAFRGIGVGGRVASAGATISAPTPGWARVIGPQNADALVEDAHLERLESLDEFSDFILAETITFLVGGLEHLLEGGGDVVVTVAHLEEFDRGAEVLVELADQLARFGTLHLALAQEEDEGGDDGGEGEGEKDECDDLNLDHVSASLSVDDGA